jgi:hypothetical protein
MKTHTGTNCSERIPIPVQFQSFGIPFFTSERDESGNVYTGRASALAGSSDQIGTNSGPAVFIPNMFNIFLFEMTYG